MFKIGKVSSQGDVFLIEFESAIAVMNSIHTKQLNPLQIDLQKEDVWYIRSEQEIKQRISDILSKT